MAGTDSLSCSSFKRLAVAFVLVVCGLTIEDVEASCSRLTTYNTALLPRLTGYRDRADVVPHALIDEDADVMCLQEVWFEQDVHRIVSMTDHIYPYHFSKLHNGVGNGPSGEENYWTESPCSALDVINFYARIFTCALRHGCVEAFQEDFSSGFSCATQNCKSQFQSVSPECVSCVALTATSLTSLMGECTTSFYGVDNRLNDAGLLILSKRPFTKVEYKSYFPGKALAVPRGYIQAEVEGMPPILCTHLSALFKGYFEYDLELNNYTNQQQEEIRLLNQVYGTADHIAIGDLNTGPDVPDQTGDKRLDGEGAGNYQMLLDMGYRCPYMEQDGRCTYCESNGLVTGSSSNAIDFAMTRSNSTLTYTSQRVLDGNVMNGNPISDHYGVRTTICN